MSAADINANDSLCSDGLGMDSIDILKIALVMVKRYKLQFRVTS